MAVELMVVVLVYGSSAGGGAAVWYWWCMAVEVVGVVMVVVLMGYTHLTEYCSCTYVIKFTDNDSCVQFLKYTKYTKYNFIPQSSTIEKDCSETQ